MREQHRVIYSVYWQLPSCNGPRVWFREGPQPINARTGLKKLRSYYTIADSEPNMFLMLVTKCRNRHCNGSISQPYQKTGEGGGLSPRYSMLKVASF